MGGGDAVPARTGQPSREVSRTMHASREAHASPSARPHRVYRQVPLFAAGVLAAIVCAWQLTGALNAQAARTRVPKFVGNVAPQGSAKKDFAAFWDQVTPENEGKWESVEPTRNQMDWRRLDAAVQFAREHNMPFKEHTLVWGRQFPSWVADLPKKQQAAEVEEWIRAYCERYPDTPMIDVVNEPDHAPPVYADALGGAGGSGYDWVLWSFRTARKHCPKAQLILNDYDVLRLDTDKFIAIARIVKRARLLDAIGAQAHDIETEPLAELQENLSKLAALDVPIYISEYDIDEYDDEKQKAIIAEQFPVFWESPSVVGITFWGYVDGATWKPHAGLLRDGVPRPALTWLMNYLHR
jgi:arabinoxylan arabinofuranohydrolase